MIVLLPALSADFQQLGSRLSFEATDPKKLRDTYIGAYPSKAEMEAIVGRRISKGKPGRPKKRD